LETGIITLAPATALLENELKAYLGG